MRWGAFFVEPRLGFGLRDDREDLDFRLCNVIEHPDVANAQSVLRLAETAESLDPILADLCRVVRQMRLKRLRDARTNRHRQILERRRGCRRKNDLKCQSGHILARFCELRQASELHEDLAIRPVRALRISEGGAQTPVAARGHPPVFGSSTALR